MSESYSVGKSNPNENVLHVLCAMLYLPSSGGGAGEDQIQLLCSCCVGGLDGMGVDSGGRGWVGVTEAGGDGGDRDAGVDHQRGVRMAEAVDGNIR